MKKLFDKVDGLVGDMSVFQGMAFEFNHGTLVVDYFNDSGEDMFICSFFPEEGETMKFAAKGMEEFKEQIVHYVLP